MIENVLSTLSLAFSLRSIISVLAGTAIGIVIGAIPGLGPASGVALLLPITFYMDPVAGMTFLLGIYNGAIYGGSISAILLGIPGTPNSVVTMFDGVEMARKGQARKALDMALWASVTGGIMSAIFLAFSAPFLAGIALKFGPPEFFGLGLLGISAVTAVSGKSVLKGVGMGFLGLLLSTVGTDPINGTPRLTLGIPALERGIPIVVLALGLFGLAQVLSDGDRGHQVVGALSVSGERLTVREYTRCLGTIVRSGLIGLVIGALPGVGANVATYLAYTQAKLSSKEPERFGSGALEGVAAPESANNAVTGSSVVPLITLGIPGSATAALLMSGLLVHGIIPGPLSYQTHAQTFRAIFVTFFLTNLVMAGLGLVGINLFAKVLRVPANILKSLVVLICFAAAYSVNCSLMDVVLMCIFAALGYVLQKYDFPRAPLILAFVLGPIVETNMRRALLSSGYDFMIFVERPISAVILVLSVTLTVYYAIQARREQVREGRMAKA